MTRADVAAVLDSLGATDATPDEAQDTARQLRAVLGAFPEPHWLQQDFHRDLEVAADLLDLGLNP